MSKKNEPPVTKAVEGISAADFEAQLARDADRHRAREAEEVARREAEERARRAIAILDADGVLVGRIDGPSDGEWSKAKPECRFLNGFDNALHRYRLTEWKPGRWRFEAIAHEKDRAGENIEGSPKVMAQIARLLLNARGRHVYREGEAEADLRVLENLLKSFDAQGA